MTTKGGYEGNVKRGVNERTKGGLKDAAHSVGGATIVEEDGDIFITDKYDFNRIKRPTIAQAKDEPYIAVRWLLGELSDMGLTNEFESKIRLGRKEDIMPTDVISVAKGDSLGKIDKKHNTTVKNLAELNGIRDVNKIRVGDRIKVG